MDNIKEYISNKLNNEQLKAALHTHTSSLILAGAGSGKTRTLTYKIAYLLYEKNIPVHKILAVTFTNKAANEMKERLVALSEDFSALGIEKDKEKITKENTEDIYTFLEIVTEKHSITNKKYSIHDLKRIGTFHSVFLKILREDIDKIDIKLNKNNLRLSMYNANFGILDTNDTQSVIKNILKRVGLKDTFKIKEVKGFISKQKNNGLDPHAFKRLVGDDYENSMLRIYAAYQKELEKSNALDFDDLLLLPYMLFKQNPNILKKRQKSFDYIMVDEAQDTNWIQFELIKMLSGENGNITLIGDDYQSIYGWRGAIMDNFLNVKKYWPDIQMFKLQINYRSRPHIVDAGNHIIKNNEKQYQKDVIAHRDEEGKITCFAHNSEMDEAANLIQLLIKMKGEKFKTWSDITILYRTNAQSSPFEQILIQEGIPYKIRGAYKFFDRMEIKNILSYVKYILNPQDSVSLKKIINIPSRKIGKTSIERLEDYALQKDKTLHEVIEDFEGIELGVSSQAKKGIIEFRNIINQIKSQLKDTEPVKIIENIVISIKYKDYLLKEEGILEKAEEKYENIGQLINMAEKYSHGNIGGIQDDSTLNGEVLLSAFMEEVVLLSDSMDSHQEELEAIKLMTVHSSKGLEFPFVFVVGLEDNMFPLSNAMMEPHLLEEERRLMYVAVTRAKEHLFLSYANSRMTWGQTKMNPPSRFIDEIPKELIKTYDFSNYENFDTNQKNNIHEGDTVRHKIFGSGYVLEIWNNVGIIRFHNPKFGIRKIECKFLERV